MAGDGEACFPPVIDRRLNGSRVGPWYNWAMPTDHRSEPEDELIVAAQSDQHRARIHAMPSGGFRVDIERLIDADDAGGAVRGQFWSAVVGLTSYADTQELARQLGTAKLSNALL